MINSIRRIIRGYKSSKGEEREDLNIMIAGAFVELLIFINMLNTIAAGPFILLGVVGVVLGISLLIFGFRCLRKYHGYF